MLLANFSKLSGKLNLNPVPSSWKVIIFRPWCEEASDYLPRAYDALLAKLLSYIIYTFLLEYSTVGLANSVFVMDPSDSVIKRFGCTFWLKKKEALSGALLYTLEEVEDEFTNQRNTDLATEDLHLSPSESSSVSSTETDCQNRIIMAVKVYNVFKSTVRKPLTIKHPVKRICQLYGRNTS